MAASGDRKPTMDEFAELIVEFDKDTIKKMILGEDDRPESIFIRILWFVANNDDNNLLPLLKEVDRDYERKYRGILANVDNNEKVSPVDFLAEDL
jgi:hypothetical protein